MFSAALATVPHQANAALAASSLPILYHHPFASAAQQQHHFLHQQQLQQPAQQPEPEPPGTDATSPSRNDILRLFFEGEIAFPVGYYLLATYSFKGVR